MRVGFVIEVLVNNCAALEIDADWYVNTSMLEPGAPAESEYRATVKLELAFWLLMGTMIELSWAPVVGVNPTARLSPELTEEALPP